MTPPETISCHTSRKMSPAVRFEWTLHAFEDILETMGPNGPKILSTRFSVPGEKTAKFQLSCQRSDYQGYVSKDGDFLGLYVKVPCGKQRRVNCVFSIKVKDGSRWGEKMFSRTVGRSGMGWTRVWALQDLKANRDTLLPDGNLTMVAELTLLQSEYTTEIETPNFEGTKTLAQDISLLLQDHPETADVVIVCGEKEFSCHKVLLSARSPVFRAMFASKTFEEGVSGRVEIVDFTCEVVGALVKAVYSDEAHDVINADKDLVCDLYRAAEKYQMDFLKVSCERNLLKILDLDNCTKIMEWALACNGGPLTDATRKFILDNATKIMSTAEFRDLMVAFPDVMLDRSADGERKRPGVDGEDEGPPAKKVAQ